MAAPQSFCVTSATSADYPAAQAAGITHVLIQAIWANLQPNGAGTALSSSQVSSLAADIQAAQAAGLKVVFEMAIHYPPSWVVSAVEQFQDQNGNLWAGTEGSGEQVVNWFWTTLGRQYVADFISQCGTAFASQPIDRIRLGGGYYDELQYPPTTVSTPNSWWLFSASMQDGTGLSSDMTVCPHPGYTPFSGGSDQEDSDVVNWFLNGLVTWVLWLIQQHKSAGFTCPLHVLQSGYGVREGWPHSNVNQQQAMAAGQDPRRVIAAYADDPQVWPWCTWADSAYVTGNDTAINAWQKVINEARSRNKHFQAWCENTGGETTAEMSTIFSSSGALSYGYVGLNWVSWSSLNAGGSNATLANFSQDIAVAG